MDDPDSPPSALEDVTRSRRVADHHHKPHRSSKDRDRTYMGGSTKELARLLMYEEREAKDLRNMLYTVKEQLKSETQRADAAEMQAKEAVLRLKSAHEARMAAQQDASRANEELQLYKLQLENARREIHKAQELLDAVEAQRIEAEDSAARARTTARKLKEEKIIRLAKEEGRRQGIEEGLAHGRNLGFEEGRAAGYARGRAAATRTYTTGRSSSTPDEDEDQDEEVVPEGSTPTEPEREPERPMSYSQQPSTGRDRRYPASPPQNRTRTTNTTPPNEPPRDSEIHPILVRNTMASPLHPPISDLPDGFIPKQDDDQRIRIPPPHELGPTPSPPPALALHRASIESIPLMIPPPSANQQDSAMSDTESAPIPQNYRRPKHVRRNSDESESTTMSQFEILAPVGPSRPVARERQPVLSAIQEEDRTSAMSSPNVRSSAYMQPTSSGYQPQSSRSQPRVHVEDYSDHNVYMRPRSPSTSPDSGRISAPQPTLRPPPEHRGSSASSINSEYEITVEPPSRPESNQSRIVPMTPSRVYLSADDDRPLPPLPPTNELPQSDHNTQPPSSYGTPVVPPSTSAPVVLDGPLPPGFIVSSFTPNVTTMAMPPFDARSNPMTPTGVPLPPSIYSGTPSVVSTGFPGPVLPSDKVVIPPIYSGGQTPGAQSSKGLYSRPPINHASDSDESSGASFDSFTTPPQAQRPQKTPKQPTYAVAPTPEHIVYPAPPRPQSTTSSGSRGTRAARVPIPPSTLGSMSPASTATNIYARPSYSRSSSGFDVIRSPSGHNAPLSPGFSAGFADPNPIPIPTPTAGHVPMTMPVIPHVERRQSSNDLRNDIYANTPAQAEPPRMGPSYSPATSHTSLATASTATATSKSKKKKAKAKTKSKFASVEEVPDEE